MGEGGETKVFVFSEDLAFSLDVSLFEFDFVLWDEVGFEVVAFGLMLCSLFEELVEDFLVLSDLDKSERV